MPEDKKFKFEEFDETKYAAETLKNVKVTLITVFAGLVTAIISRLIWSLPISYNVQLGFIPGIIGLFLVRYFFKWAGFSPEDIKISRFLWSMFLYAVSWIIIWTISVNPPFA